MRLIVMFDLPTCSRQEKKTYMLFKKFLRQDGYRMEQFSVYSRPCLGQESAESHIKRLKTNLPSVGRVVAFVFTEKQYEDRKVLVCSEEYESKLSDIGDQMTLFL